MLLVDTSQLSDDFGICVIIQYIIWCNHRGRLKRMTVFWKFNLIKILFLLLPVWEFFIPHGRNLTGNNKPISYKCKVLKTFWPSGKFTYIDKYIKSEAVNIVSWSQTSKAPGWYCLFRLLLLVFVTCLWKRRRSLSLALPSPSETCSSGVPRPSPSPAGPPSSAPPPSAPPVGWSPTSCPPATPRKGQLTKANVGEQTIWIPVPARLLTPGTAPPCVW